MVEVLKKSLVVSKGVFAKATINLAIAPLKAIVASVTATEMMKVA